jgi:pilus assembly protein CpaE
MEGADDALVRASERGRRGTTMSQTQHAGARPASHLRVQTAIQNVLEQLRRKREPAAAKPVVRSVAIAIGEGGLRDRVRLALSTVPLHLASEAGACGSVAELAGDVGRLQPDILLLGLEGLPAESGEVVRQIRRIQPAPRVVVVHDSPNPETILEVMRAGAAEFLYPPFDEQFAAALMRLAGECSREPEHVGAGSVFGFVSVKGGCGATTVACHTAGYLRHQTGKRVLLADMDFCSGNTGYLMRAQPRYTIVDALDNLKRIDTTLWKALVTPTADGVDVIPAPAEPVEAGIGAPALARLIHFWRSQYDIIVVDLGHGLTPAVCQLRDALDGLVLVTTDELPALRLARQSIGAFARQSAGVKGLHLVINRMPRRAAIQVPELERILEFPVYAAIPNRYRDVSEAYAEARLVDAGSALGIPLSAFAAKLAGIQEAGKPRKLTLFG